MRLLPNTDFESCRVRLTTGAAESDQTDHISAEKEGLNISMHRLRKLQSQITRITLLQRSTLQQTDQILQRREALTQASAVFKENTVRKCVYDEIKSQNRLQHRYFSEIFERNVTEACASAETGSLESTIWGQNALSCSRQTK